MFQRSLHISSITLGVNFEIFTADINADLLSNSITMTSYLNILNTRGFKQKWISLLELMKGRNLKTIRYSFKTMFKSCSNNSSCDNQSIVLKPCFSDHFVIMISVNFTISCNKLKRD